MNEINQSPKDNNSHEISSTDKIEKRDRML